MYLDEGAVEQPEPGRALDLGLSYQLPGPTPGKPAGPMHPLLLSMPPTKQENKVLTNIKKASLESMRIFFPRNLRLLK